MHPHSHGTPIKHVLDIISVPAVFACWCVLKDCFLMKKQVSLFFDLTHEAISNSELLRFYCLALSSAFCLNWLFYMIQLGMPLNSGKECEKTNICFNDFRKLWATFYFKFTWFKIYLRKRGKKSIYMVILHTYNLIGTLKKKMILECKLSLLKMLVS